MADDVSLNKFFKKMGNLYSPSWSIPPNDIYRFSIYIALRGKRWMFKISARAAPRR